ncbi:MAG: hypothetical protein WCX79_01050 [Candidatus Paceibacterota bacterium]|jgi:hypothetical protein
MLVDKIKTDFEVSNSLNAESSPKTTYTFLLFGLEREFFGQIISGASTDIQISDGFACIVAFCPDKPIREKIWADFTGMKKGGTPTREAAILSLGSLTDYLAECLDLTESSMGGFL